MLTGQYGTIVVEGFNVQKLAQHSPLAAKLVESGLGETRRQLVYKAEPAGVRIVVLPDGTLTNGICSTCGADNGKIAASKDDWQCQSCGAIHERNINSAKNILAAGLSDENE